MTIDIKGHAVIIDDDDSERILARSWVMAGNGIYFVSYSHRVGRQSKYFRLHRFIMGYGPGDPVVIDHINSDTLDNRKVNLRICTQAENMMNQKRRVDNKSGYKGVSWNSEKRKWCAEIHYQNNKIRLGYFVTPIEAYEKYCEAAKKYHGDFARLE